MSGRPNIRAHTVLVLDRGMSLVRNRKRIIGNGQGYVAGVKFDHAIRTLVLSIPQETFTKDVPCWMTRNL
jgi:hypothetical protein